MIDGDEYPHLMSQVPFAGHGSRKIYKVALDARTQIRIVDFRKLLRTGADLRYGGGLPCCRRTRGYGDIGIWDDLRSKGLSS